MYDVAIIGAGPAGYTSALYASRAGLNVVLYEGVTPGGQLTTTTEVENYPGFPGGIQGPELMDKFREQAGNFGATIISDFITRVDFSQLPLQLWDSRGNLIEARAVIVATGATAKWLDVEGEELLKGRGVSACATCDGFFFRGKEVAVIGGGDTAMEEALFLSKFASKVYLIHRSNNFRASQIMLDRVKANPKIEIIPGYQVRKFIGQDKLEALELSGTFTRDIHRLNVAGAFVAIGHKPATDIFQGQLELDASGYIVTSPGSTRTSVEGVFAAGDVQDHIYRQAITAAGTGCMAAIDAERWLAGN